MYAVDFRVHSAAIIIEGLTGENESAILKSMKRIAGLSWQKAMIDYNGRQAGRRGAVGRGETSGERQRRYKMLREELRFWWEAVKHRPAPRLSDGGLVGGFGEWSQKAGGTSG